MNYQNTNDLKFDLSNTVNLKGKKLLKSNKLSDINTQTFDMRNKG